MPQPLDAEALLGAPCCEKFRSCADAGGLRDGGVGGVVGSAEMCSTPRGHEGLVLDTLSWPWMS